MSQRQVLHCVDAHAEGEPSRIVVGGIVGIPGETLLDKMRWLQAEGDALRTRVLYEPRGSAPLSGDIVLPPVDPRADAAFIIMESSSYEGMSGTNTINTATVLLETGMLPMREPVTELTLEAPAGLVPIVARCRDGRCEAITFHNVPSFASALDAEVEVDGLGTLSVDIAYGGAFCAFVDAAAVGHRIEPASARALAELGERIRPAIAAQCDVRHPVEPRLGHLSFVVFVDSAGDGADARQATVVSPGRLDRSPTGTATSARMAVLAARGQLDEGGRYVAESVIGTRFVGEVLGRTSVGEVEAIRPAITGRAWITGYHQLVIDPTDPLADGFTLPDTWGAGTPGGLLNV
jgi:proline racemase